jgi:hypothetical protein
MPNAKKCSHTLILLVISPSAQIRVRVEVSVSDNVRVRVMVRVIKKGNIVCEGHACVVDNDQETAK